MAEETQVKKEWISPFSLDVESKIEWEKLNSASPLNERLIEYITDREIELLKLMHTVEIMGGSQPIKPFWRNYREGKKSIKKLVRFKALVEHKMIYSGQSNPVSLYTLGPLGEKAIDVPSRINYWLAYSHEQVMRKLIFSQMYVRFKEIFEDVEINLDYHPFSGIITVENLNLKVAVLRGNVNAIRKALKWGGWDKQANKLIIIAERIEHIEPLLPDLNDVSVRFTTDYNILKVPLSDAFIMYSKDEGWREEHIPKFK